MHTQIKLQSYLQTNIVLNEILPMTKVWSVKEMHKLVNKMINNRIAKKISLIKKRSRYCNNVKNTFKDGYRQYKPSNILLSFLNSCVSILGVLLLRAITFWYVFPIFDILGINYSPPINFSSFNLIMQSKFDKKVQSYYDKCFMLST